jgi:NAD(P)-dependent dehydrogenase (short-subunit alcohol dehydrogenase family)
MQRTALVTGGSKGIGLAIIRKFLEGGFEVISASRSRGGLDELVAAFPGKLEVFLGDISERGQVGLLAEKVRDKGLRLDVLVNNAGIFMPGQIHTEEEGVFDLQMGLNIAAPYHLTRAMLPMMMPHPGGYIFNICSTASIIPYVNGGSYCISKHAMLGLTKVLRQEMMPFRISVSAVLPGATLTDSWSSTDLPDSRFMRPQNVAECLWFAWQNRENCVMEEILLRPVEGDI